MKKIYPKSKSNLFIQAILVIAWLNPGYSQDGEGGWTQMESMSSARFFGAACYLDGKIFTTGGYDDSFDWMANAEVYSISANEWTTLANMHQVRLGGTMETMNNKVFAIGGTYSTDPAFTNVEEYDPGSDTWTILENTPEKCWGHSSCILNNKVYVMGGYNKDILAKDSCFIYDPGTDSWERVSSINYPRAYAACCTFNEKIYIFGGTKRFDPSSITNSAEVYDPATDTWENISNMPQYMIAHVVIADEENGVIVLMYRNRMYAYFPLEDKYTRMQDLPSYCYCNGASAVMYNRYIYLLGGEANTVNVVLSDVWRFNLDSLQEWVDPDPVSLEYNRNGNSFSNLKQIYPNPFISSTDIEYELFSPGEVLLEIYNCLGKQLVVLVDQHQAPGNYHVNWNAEDVTPGIYFCKLKVNSYDQILKLIKSH